MIYTNRLNIRHHTVSDLVWLSKLYSDEKVMYYLPDMLNKDIDIIKGKLLTIIEDQESVERQNYFYCMELKRENICIGEIGFTVEYQEKEAVCDIGYFIFPEFWGKGYVSEAMEEVIKFAFKECDVTKIIATCYRENIASERVMQKSGMKIVEGSVTTRIHNGAEKERIKYQLSKQDFLERNS